MSTDFKKVSIVDDRLMTTDSLNYGVFRGGQNVTNVVMPAISVTANALNFQVPFPSESTVLDREVYLQTETRYFFQLSTAARGIPVFGPILTTGSPFNNVNTIPTPSVVVGYKCPIVLGNNISMAAFPSQRTMSTIQVQLNNNITTINSSDVLPALLRCSDMICWEKTNMTASGVDRLASCNDECLSVNNSNLSSYDLVQGGKFVGNGSFVATLTPLINFPADPNGPLDIYNYRTALDDGGTTFFCIQYKSTEPLIAPPFIWNKTLSNKMGIYGLQNFSVVCNYGDVSRAIKYAPYVNFVSNVQPPLAGATQLTSIALVDPAPPSAAPNTPFSSTIQPMGFFSDGTGNIIRVYQSVLNANLQMKYLTPHGTDVKPLRNVCPLLEFPRYISSSGITGQTNKIPRATEDASPLGITNSILKPTAANLSSQTYTFNQVPDKLIIFVRQQSQAGLGLPNTLNTLDCPWNDVALAIQNISIQFNNHSGILANATQEMLFHMSQEAGSNQDWLSFSGVSNSMTGRSVNSLSRYFKQIPHIEVIDGVNAWSNNTKSLLNCGDSFNTPTIGSYLMLDMGRHLELQEPYFAPGSLGSFQLQFNLQVLNYLTVDFTPEIVVIPVNSGLLVTEKGQTSSYSGILTKSDVLDASLQEPYGHQEIKRIVGHGHGDSSKVLPKKLVPLGGKSAGGKSGGMMDHRLM